MAAALAVTYGYVRHELRHLTGAPRRWPPARANAPGRPRRRSRAAAPTARRITRRRGKACRWATAASSPSRAEYKDQDHTERGGYDLRQQYPLVNGAFDPREATFDRFNAWYGEPEMKQKTLLRQRRLRPRRAACKLYGWASYQDRDVALSRLLSSLRATRATCSQIYPDGFLPIIAPDVDDYSAAVGVIVERWATGTWIPRSSTARTRWTSPSRTR